MIPNTIVLHHSLTIDSQTVSWSAIRKYHISWKLEGQILSPDPNVIKDLIGIGAPIQKPWTDIGYHFGIERIGDTYEILTGRMIDQPGAHCTQQGMNKRAIGICLVGNFDLAPPPAEQWNLTLKLVRAYMKLLNIPLDQIFGHRELSSYKTCPGRLFDLDQFRKEIEAWDSI